MTPGDRVAQARAWNGLTAVLEYQGDNRARLEERADAPKRWRAQAGDEATAKTELAVALEPAGTRLAPAGRRGGGHGTRQPHS